MKLKNSIITLNDDEVKICKYIGKKRYEAARKNGVKDRKIGNQDNDFMDANGFGGEFAFCKMFNLMPDFFIKQPNSGLPEYDAVFSFGIKVDVKTTPYDFGRLLVAKWKSGDVDLYALMTGLLPTFTFRGFATKELALDKGNLRCFGHGEGYALEQSELLDITDIYNIKESCSKIKTLNTL